MGRDPTLQPSSAVNNLTFSTLPTGKISLLFKLIHKPEVASNHSNNQLKKVNCSWESLQKTSVSSANSRCKTWITTLSLPLILQPDRKPSLTTLLMRLLKVLTLIFVSCNEHLEPNLWSFELDLWIFKDLSSNLQRFDPQIFEGLIDKWRENGLTEWQWLLERQLGWKGQLTRVDGWC